MELDTNSSVVDFIYLFIYFFLLILELKKLSGKLYIYLK